MSGLVRFGVLSDADILETYKPLRDAAILMEDEDDAFARVAIAIADELLAELGRRGLAELVGPDPIEA